MQNIRTSQHSCYKGRDISHHEQYKLQSAKVYNWKLGTRLAWEIYKTLSIASDSANISYLALFPELWRGRKASHWIICAIEVKTYHHWKLGIRLTCKKPISITNESESTFKFGIISQVLWQKKYFSLWMAYGIKEKIGPNTSYEPNWHATCKNHSV